MREKERCGGASRSMISSGSSIERGAMVTSRRLRVDRGEHFVDVHVFAVVAGFRRDAAGQIQAEAIRDGFGTDFVSRRGDVRGKLLGRTEKAAAPVIHLKGDE